jgi:hypothetical protein
MDSATAISNKNALDLLKGISLSTNLQKSEDGILLAEDQYPENLNPIFSKSDSATDLNHTLELLKHRVTNICLQAVQKALKNSDKSSSSLLFTPQDSTAATLQYTVRCPQENHTPNPTLRVCYFITL